MKSGYGYGFPMVPFVGSRSSVFNPLNVRGLQQYLNSKNATPSSWLDQSTNVFNFNQAIAGFQPNTTDPLKVVYDGVDDYQRYVASQPLNDSQGVFFGSGYRNADGSLSYFFNSSNETVNNELFSFYCDMTGKVGLLFNNLSVLTTVTSTNSIPVGSYFYFSISSTGNNYFFTLNGKTEPFTATNNNGDWFDKILNRTNLTISTLIRPTKVYTKSSINKVLYSNVVLTASEISEINNFMSNPNN